MKTPQEMVREFHEVFGLVANDKLTQPDPETCQLRRHLIAEESSEACYELMKHPSELDKVAKELADLAYVVYGTAVSFGIDLDAVIEEVHKSNMSKLDDDGKPIYREDGKILKSNNYKPADVYKVLYGSGS